MRSFLIITSFILLIGIMLPLPVLGKDEKAPGMIKKEKMEMTEQEEASPPAMPLQFKNGQTRQPLDRVVGKNSNKGKIGIGQLEDLFHRLATDSSGLKKELKRRKLAHIMIRPATPAAQVKRHAVEGMISSINGDMVTLVHQIQQSRTYQIQILPTTIVTQRGATPSATVQLTVGERVIVMGVPSTQGVLQATRIHIIPGASPGSPLPTGLPTTEAPAAISPTASQMPKDTETPSPTLEPSITPAADPTSTPTP